MNIKLSVVSIFKLVAETQSKASFIIKMIA
ncbi:hypothetical protein SAMN05443429_1016 [Cruoricaptor ignavus]|uniref:Uncharacterized protein n=1 Tax=Cruoricaptor ignavus TaxID=1118202 RepID=A0A1M5ZX37_9FLAO|nr:hypothetical protein SAMN05443429_1016 [Cruoricaptor ignavus]